ncbi:hypothetical protein DL96DRAFT_1720660 [Flagelloscypha sp. PMI_526]|nr:hypothetical protein DL96DRAFT_1720660 [Flagelloscypha sp. PMI_526]
MSRTGLPIELLDMIIEWVSESGDHRDLPALALASRHLVRSIQVILFKKITLRAPKTQPRFFLSLFKASPHLAFLVKSVTLTQSVVRQRAVVAVLRLLGNVERLVFPAGECEFDESSPEFRYAERTQWSWTAPSSDPLMVAALGTIGQHLPQLKELVLHDIHHFPLDLILEHVPQLFHLEFAWTTLPPGISNVTHALKSLRWCIGESSFVQNPPSTWLLGPSLTHLHFVIRGSTMTHYPSCQLLESLQSLTLEIRYSHSNTDAFLPFFLHTLNTVPNVAPLTILIVILRKFNDGTSLSKTGENVAKLGAVVLQRSIPLKKMRILMFGFTCGPDDVRSALAFLGGSTEVDVETNENRLFGI